MLFKPTNYQIKKTMPKWSLPNLGGVNILLAFIVPLSLLYLNTHTKQNDACDI